MIRNASPMKKSRDVKQDQSTKLHVIFAVLTAAALINYSFDQLEQQMNLPVLLDIAAFAALFLAVFFLLPANRAWRIPLALAWTGWMIFFHLGNVLYYRFYQTWVYLDILNQWREAPVLSSSIRQLFAWFDWIWALALPLVTTILAASSRGHVRRRRVVPALLLVGVLLAGTHALVATGKAQRLSSQPMMYFARGHLQKAFSGGGQVTCGDVDPLYPYDRQTYRRAPESGACLTQVPLAGEQGPEVPYNVVFILMESVVAKASGRYGAEPSYLPHFDRLAGQSLWARYFYANGSQTARAEMACLCSYYPNFAGGPIYVNHEDADLRCLPQILRSSGYRTLWFSGFQRSHYNKAGFLSRHGIEQIYDIADMPPEANTIGWGVADEDTFDFAMNKLDQTAQPFFAEIMTLSNHFPFNHPYPTNPDVPQGSFDPLYQNYMKGIYYTDYAVGRFIEQAREKPWFERTIFIVVGDHGIWHFPKTQKLSEAQKQEIYFRMPFLIYAPGIVAPRRIDRVASQVDLAPTVLDILGIHTKHAFVGRSLLREYDEPHFALMLRDQQWNLRSEDEYCYDFGTECFYDHYPFCPEGYVKEAHKTLVCFQYEGDLLLPLDRNPPALDPRRAAELTDLAGRLVTTSGRLLRRKMIYR